jgi:hypothetical protein
MENWIDHRGSKLRDGTEGANDSLTMLGGDTCKNLLWDWEVRLRIIPIARFARRLF